jgi:hypothetical protein
MKIIKEVEKIWYENGEGFCMINPKNKEGFNEVKTRVVIMEGIEEIIMYFPNESGGPIITGESVEEVERKFEEALKIMMIYKSLNMYLIMNN